MPINISKPYQESRKISYNFSLFGLAKFKFYFANCLKNVWLDTVCLILDANRPLHCIWLLWLLGRLKPIILPSLHFLYHLLIEETGSIVGPAQYSPFWIWLTASAASVLFSIPRISGKLFVRFRGQIRLWVKGFWQESIIGGAGTSCYRWAVQGCTTWPLQYPVPHQLLVLISG